MSTTLSAPAITGAWRSDLTHSTVDFAVRHMVVSTYRGQLRDFDATLTVDGDALVLAGRAPVRSIDVRDEALAAHLLAPDFFDAERHPELVLESRSVELDGERVTIVADLTIRGTTRTVTLTGTAAGPIEDPFGSTRLGLALETTIDRRDFGLDYTVPLPGGGIALGFEVRIAAQLELVRGD
jgi:polyisoprenoid-binding protein YceI